jgi:hypothetical protein
MSQYQNPSGLDLRGLFVLVNRCGDHHAKNEIDTVADRDPNRQRDRQQLRK